MLIKLTNKKCQRTRNSYDNSFLHCIALITDQGIKQNSSFWIFFFIFFYDDVYAIKLDSTKMCHVILQWSRPYAQSSIGILLLVLRMP